MRPSGAANIRLRRLPGPPGFRHVVNENVSRAIPSRKPQHKRRPLARHSWSWAIANGKPAFVLQVVCDVERKSNSDHADERCYFPKYPGPFSSCRLDPDDTDCWMSRVPVSN